MREDGANLVRMVLDLANKLTSLMFISNGLDDKRVSGTFEYVKMTVFEYRMAITVYEKGTKAQIMDFRIENV